MKRPILVLGLLALASSNAFGAYIFGFTTGTSLLTTSAPEWAMALPVGLRTSLFAIGGSLAPVGEVPARALPS
jgi:hypothetical protein